MNILTSLTILLKVKEGLHSNKATQSWTLENKELCLHA